MWSIATDDPLALHHSICLNLFSQLPALNQGKDWVVIELTIGRTVPILPRHDL